MEKHLDIKPFQETLHQSLCGPASLKIVLDYYNDSHTEEELAKLSSWNESLGVNDKGIKSAAEKLGYQVTIENESGFESIENWLEKDVPLVVNWFTRGRYDYPESDVADGHYSVVSGLDDNFIYLQDPEVGEIRKLTRDNFMRVWFDYSDKFINRENLILRQLIAIYK